MSFVEIEFMQAMQMLEDGDIENLYYWIGGSLQPTKNYKSDFDNLKERRYFKKLGA